MLIVAFMSYSTMSFSSDSLFEVALLGSLLTVAGLLIYRAMIEDKVINRSYMNYYTKFYYDFQMRSKLPRPSLTFSRDIYNVFVNVCMLKDYVHYQRSHDSNEEFRDEMTFPLKRILNDVRYINDISFNAFTQEIGLYPPVYFESIEIKRRRYKFFYDNAKNSELKHELAMLIGIKPTDEIDRLENNSFEVQTPDKILNHLEDNII